MKNKKISIIGTSLKKNSNSHKMAKFFSEISTSNYLDLRFRNIPMCDANESFSHKDVVWLSDCVKDDDVIVFSTPIYNYMVNALAKSVVEHLGGILSHKWIGFMCAGGSMGSYLSVSSIMVSILFDFNAFMIPKIVYATQEEFSKEGLLSDVLQERIRSFVDTIQQLPDVRTVFVK